jgi:hypothetical protein
MVMKIRSAMASAVLTMNSNGHPFVVTTLDVKGIWTVFARPVVVSRCVIDLFATIEIVRCKE